jgi:putative phosphoribosyl transferase
MDAPFRDRHEAGRVLARALEGYRHFPGLLVLALPRGGVPVGFEVARHLSAPLDVFLVRKLGVPGQEELAMGAIASGGIVVRSEEILRYLQISPSDFETVRQKEQRELERRERLYRGSRPFPDVSGRTAILVDDGLATGFSMRAAVAALRKKGPATVVVGVPIAPPETCSALRQEADDVVCARTPEPFYAVGMWYEDFEQTTDEEVRELLSSPYALKEQT